MGAIRLLLRRTDAEEFPLSQLNPETPPVVTDIHHLLSLRTKRGCNVRDRIDPPAGQNLRVRLGFRTHSNPGIFLWRPDGVHIFSNEKITIPNHIDRAIVHRQQKL
jgi:hypothetical protein